MRNILDGIENAAARVRVLGEKAVDNAAVRLEELKPAAGKVIGETKDFLDKAGDGIEQAVEEAKDAIARAIDSLTPEEEAPAAEESESQPKSRSPFDEIESEVQSQLNTIRSAQSTPGAFSDYISRKFGKNDQ